MALNVDIICFLAEQVYNHATGKLKKSTKINGAIFILTKSKNIAIYEQNRKSCCV